jgi:hypothetical protein
VDAIRAFENDFADFIESDLSAVIILPGTTRFESGTNDREHDRLEIDLIVRRKGAVDEDVPTVISPTASLARWRSHVEVLLW